MKKLSQDMKETLIAFTIIIVAAIIISFLVKNVIDYTNQEKLNEEISLDDYKMLRVDIKLDCYTMPQHCKMLKDKLRGYFADEKVTKKEYYEYIMFTSSLYQDPKAKESLLKTLE